MWKEWGGRFCGFKRSLEGTETLTRGWLRLAAGGGKEEIKKNSENIQENWGE